MIRFKEQFITPEMAKDFLLSNTHNRLVNLKLVDRYSDDIRFDRWKSNTGETIKVAESGRILDGQHRLHAIIKAEKGINIHLATGLNDEVFDVIDTGKNRSGVDVFTINGTANASIMPSIIQSYINVKKSRIKLNTKGLTNNMVLDLYNENPELWQQIARKSKNFYLQFNKILNRSIIGGLYKNFLEVSSEEITNDFFTQLCIGKEFTNQTIFWLRNRLIEDRISSLKIPTAVKYELLIKSWNNFRKFKQTKSLRITGEIEKIL